MAVPFGQLHVTTVKQSWKHAIAVKYEVWSPIYPTKYPQNSNIRWTLVGNRIVDHSDVVGASHVGAAPTTSSFSTEHLASIDCVQTTARRDEKHLILMIWCDLYYRFDGSWWFGTRQKSPCWLRVVNHVKSCQSRSASWYFQRHVSRCLNKYAEQMYISHYYKLQTFQLFCIIHTSVMLFDVTQTQRNPIERFHLQRLQVDIYATSTCIR